MERIYAPVGPRVGGGQGEQLPPSPPKKKKKKKKAFPGKTLTQFGQK